MSILPRFLGILGLAASLMPLSAGENDWFVPLGQPPEARPSGFLAENPSPSAIAGDSITPHGAETGTNATLLVWQGDLGGEPPLATMRISG